ncbi:MAG: TlyA family RNA methyltransferase [Ruminococcaceae bacterium]|nr:TlyA family RNA methyltransferase [Oscillospiraceae bacterium]
MDIIFPPERLDVYLVRRSKVSSRELARKLILSECVLIDGKIITKPSHKIEKEVEIEIKENELTKYVSRGALKLECALDTFNIDVKGLVAADFGASTGGFTDLLLQRGAKKVYAIENGNNQLHEKLRCDKRVVSLENTNARYIEKGFIPPVDIVVMDVSFISQTKLYYSTRNVLKKGGSFVSLIKPQFEAGKSALNKRGIIKDPEIYKKVIENVEKEASLFNFKKINCVESSILGGDGNKEFLIHFIYDEEEVSE